MAKSKKSPKGHGSSSMTLIFPPFLFLGPLSSACSIPQLTTNGITHILSIGTTPAERLPDITYRRLSLNDTPDSSISEVSLAANEFISAAVRSHCGRGRVLVHCSAAVSRSPTIVTAYLMRCEGLTLIRALGVVIRARPSVSPNSGFLAQLKALELEVFGLQTFELEELPRKKDERLAIFRGSSP